MNEFNGILTKVDTEDLDILKNNPQMFWEGVTSIGESAFWQCDSLTKINIPEGVTNIGDAAFYFCKSLTKVTIPESLTSIGKSAFERCESLKKLNLPEGVLSIGDYAFEDCKSLKELNIPKSVTNIGSFVFCNCESLKELNLPKGVTSIGDYVFKGCKSLKELNLPEGVKNIGECAFRDCKSLTELNIPVSVTSIGDFAFEDCSSLKEIIIPENIENIGYKCMPQNVDTSVIYKNKRGIDNIFNGPLFNALGFENIKEKFKNREEPLKMSYINHLCENFNLNQYDVSYVEFVKFCSVIGLFEPSTVSIKKEGKEVKVSDVAYEVIQKMFKSGHLDYSSMHADLSSLKFQGYNKGLLEFLAKNKTNAEELAKEMKDFINIESWFRDRTNMNINGEIQLNGDIPTIEENRYKVYAYTESGDGVYREHWYASTIDLIKKEVANKVFTGVNAKNKHIAEALASHAMKDQVHFNKAVEIDEERKALVNAGNIKNNILEQQIRQDIIEAVDKYKEKTSNLKNEIISNLSETTAVLVDNRKKVFTYEMLDKSSEENFVMGNLTSCCARLYGAGAGAQRAMIIHPDMQPLVVRDISGEIVAFSIVYVNREKGYAVLNDIEMNNKYDNDNSAVKDIYDKFIEGIDAFATQYNKENPKAKIDKIHCGVSPRNDGFMPVNKYIRGNKRGELLEAVNFGEYKYNGDGEYPGDWHKEQYVVWAANEEGNNERK